MEYTDQQTDKMGGDPQVLEYWTDQRLSEAISADIELTAEFNVKEAEEYLRQVVSEDSARSVVNVAEPYAAYETLRTTPVTNFSPTNGKVFFRNATNGVDYMCSGSAVNSGSTRLVVTAGHCVHGGPGGAWHQNWVFIPGYSYGSRPQGTFSAYRLRTMTDWITYGETARGFNSDVAFVTTYANASGRTVVSQVGGHGLRTGGSLSNLDISVFGYPGNLNNGEAMWACWGTTGSRWLSLYQFHSISGCGFGGGSSGGPWLTDYSNSTGLGYVTTVTSWGPVNSTAYSNGPYLRGDIWTMYNDANNDW